MIQSSLRHWNHKYSCRHTYGWSLKGVKLWTSTQLQGPMTSTLLARQWTSVFDKDKVILKQLCDYHLLLQESD
jgi:hypothetical protein